MDIGKRIRQLRIKNGLTLEELASRTELTKGFLSQLERNLASPSIQTLEDISEALGTSMSKFFAEEEDKKFVFTKEDAFVDEQEDMTIHWIVPNAQKNSMEPILLELQPHCRSMEIEPHDGEEFGFVLSGRVVMVTGQNNKGTIIRKGEVFYTNGDESHYLENRTDHVVSVLWISTPPIF